jgi:uncharacterized membrane protein
VPKRLALLAILFCILGVLCLWDAVRAILGQWVSLGFIFWLLLPVGIGLLRGKSAARSWARLLIAIGYCICALAVVVAALHPDSLYSAGTHGEALRLRFTVGAVITAAILYLMQRTLGSQPVTDYLQRGAPFTVAPADDDAEGAGSGSV